MHAIGFMEQALRVKSADGLFDLLRGTLANAGYDMLAYAPMESGTLIRGVSRRWQDHFSRGVENRTDPILNRLRAAPRPIIVSELFDLSAEERQHVEDTRDAGVRNGVTLPLLTSRGDIAAIGIHTSHKGVSPRADISSLSLIAVQFHVAHGLLRGRAAPAIELSARERDILSWSLQGKSKWAIGEILAISEHGVDFHLRNIYRKLGVTSRVQAVAKAVALGLIQP